MSYSDMLGSSYGDSPSKTSFPLANIVIPLFLQIAAALGYLFILPAEVAIPVNIHRSIIAATPTFKPLIQAPPNRICLNILICACIVLSMISAFFIVASRQHAPGKISTSPLPAAVESSSAIANAGSCHSSHFSSSSSSPSSSPPEDSEPSPSPAPVKLEDQPSLPDSPSDPSPPPPPPPPSPPSTPAPALGPSAWSILLILLIILVFIVCGADIYQNSLGLGVWFNFCKQYVQGSRIYPHLLSFAMSIQELLEPIWSKRLAPILLPLIAKSRTIIQSFHALPHSLLSSYLPKIHALFKSFVHGEIQLSFTALLANGSAAVKYIQRTKIGEQVAAFLSKSDTVLGSVRRVKRFVRFSSFLAKTIFSRLRTSRPPPIIKPAYNFQRHDFGNSSHAERFELHLQQLIQASQPPQTESLTALGGFVAGVLAIVAIRFVDDLSRRLLSKARTVSASPSEVDQLLGSTPSSPLSPASSVPLGLSSSTSVCSECQKASITPSPSVTAPIAESPAPAVTSPIESSIMPSIVATPTQISPPSETDPSLAVTSSSSKSSLCSSQESIRVKVSEADSPSSRSVQQPRNNRPVPSFANLSPISRPSPNLAFSPPVFRAPDWPSRSPSNLVSEDSEASLSLSDAVGFEIPPNWDLSTAFSIPRSLQDFTWSPDNVPVPAQFPSRPTMTLTPTDTFIRRPAKSLQDRRLTAEVEQTIVGDGLGLGISGVARLPSTPALGAPPSPTGYYSPGFACGPRRQVRSAVARRTLVALSPQVSPWTPALPGANLEEDEFEGWA